MAERAALLVTCDAASCLVAGLARVTIEFRGYAVRSSPPERGVRLRLVRLVARGASILAMTRHAVAAVLPEHVVPCLAPVLKSPVPVVAAGLRLAHLLAMATVAVAGGNLYSV